VRASARCEERAEARLGSGAKAGAEATRTAGEQRASRWGQRLVRAVANAVERLGCRTLAGTGRESAHGATWLGWRRAAVMRASDAQAGR
jgi:hypothetical protein